MRKLRPTNPLLRDLVPYDPRYLPAEVMLSANENPNDVAPEVRRAIAQALESLPLHRYPDPLANQLRDALAAWHGLARDNVMLGNGGDELLFNLMLAWGGQGRTLINLPPTFSVYAANAYLTNTRVIDVPRCADFSIDTQAVLARLAKGDVDMVVVCSPNNPTGNLADLAFVQQLLESSDALVLVDEAYGEFAATSVLPLLESYDNLAILHTFSKAYSLAGVRLGYLLASPEVIRELAKVRQPYSVDAVSQAIGLEVCAHRDAFQPGIDALIVQRQRLFDALSNMSEVQVYPSHANFLFFHVSPLVAEGLWQACFDAGVLIRDFSQGAFTPGCFRVTVGSKEENNRFLDVLGSYMAERGRA